MKNYYIRSDTLGELNDACKEWLESQGWKVTRPGVTAPEHAQNTPTRPSEPPQAPLPGAQFKPQAEPQKPATGPNNAKSSPASGNAAKSDVIRILTRLTRARGADAAKALLKDESGRIRGIDSVDPRAYPAIIKAAEGMLNG